MSHARTKAAKPAAAAKPAPAPEKPAQAATMPMDPTWVAADAERALASIEAAGSDAERLIEAWIAAANAAALGAVGDQATGAVRKAARRGINVLRSRGVSVPDRAPRVASLGGVRAPETLEAWLIAPDASGAELVVIAARSPAGRHRAAFVTLRPGTALLRVEAGELSQSQLRESFSRIHPGTAYRPASVPLAWARARVAAARQAHAASGAPLPLGLTSSADLLEPAPDAEPPHPFDEEGLELAPEDAALLACESAALHRLPEFASWLPPMRAMEELLARVGEKLEADKDAEPGAVDALLREELRAATDRWFTPERREALVLLMKDCALSILSREGEQPALEVVAAMSAIKSAGLITEPPHEVGFLRAYFEKGLAVLMAQGEGKLRIPMRARPPQ